MMELAAGYMLLALLFVERAVQKVVDLGPGEHLLAGFGLPGWLVWPAVVFNTDAGFFLLLNLYVVA